MPPLASLAGTNTTFKLAESDCKRRSRPRSIQGSHRTRKGICRSKPQSLETGNTDAHGQGCGGESLGCCRGVLQSTIRSTETRWDVEANFGPVQTEQVYYSPQIQARQHTDGNVCPIFQGLDGKTRLEGCVLPCSNTSKQQKISKVQCSRRTLSVPCTTVRPINSSIRFHSDSEQCGGLSEETRGHSDNLPGRLAHHSRDQCSSQQPHTSELCPPRESGLHYQQGEKPTLSKSRMCLSRSDVKHSKGFCLPIGEEQRSVDTLHKGSIQIFSGDSSENAVSIGTDEFLSQPHSQRSFTDETSTILADGKMEDGIRQTRGCSLGRSTIEKDSRMVDQPQTGERGQSVSSRNKSYNTVGCVFNWMGSCIGDRPNSVRSVGQSRKHSTHQHAGVTGIVQCTNSVQGLPKRLNCSLPSGQFNSGQLHKERGGHKVAPTMSPCLGASALVRRESNSDSNSSYSRQNEPGVGQSVKGSHPYRVVNASPSGKSYIQNLGHSYDRPLCDQSESQTESVLQPPARPCSSGSRCTESELDRNVRICVSSKPNSSDRVEEDSKRGLQDHSYSTTLARKKLVHTYPKPADSSASETTSNEQIVVSERQISQKTGTIQLSRMDAFKRSRTKEGFSEAAASYAGKCVKESSQNVYAGKWRVYEDWCAGRQMDPLSISAPQLIDFLIYLFEERKLSVTSIKGYRSAITHVLGRNFPTDSTDMMSEVLRGMSLVSHVPAKSRIPKWDLTVVLNHLSKQPSGLRSLSLKCVFLLALSSGRRISEIHALQRKVYEVDKDGVSLQADNAFLAKTQKPGSKPIEVEVKCNPLNSDLCPMTTLLQYINDTNDIANDLKSEKLFFSYVKPHNPVSKSSVARWVATAIRDAYKELNDVPKANAHEVRAIASSMFIGPEDDVKDILDSGLWSSKWSYLGFYKRLIPTEWDFSQFSSVVVVNKVMKF